MSYPRFSLFYEQTTAIGILSVSFLYSSVNVVACTLDGCIPLEAAQKAHNHVLLVGTLSSGVSERERERERETKKKKKAENELRVAIWNRDIQHLKRSPPQWLLKLLNTELCHERCWRIPRSQELCMCVCLVLLPFSLYTRFCVYIVFQLSAVLVTTVVRFPWGPVAADTLLIIRSSSAFQIQSKSATTTATD